MRNRRPYWNCVFSSASFRLTRYSRSSHPRPPPNKPRPPSPAQRNGLERTSQSNVLQRLPWNPLPLPPPPQPMGSLEKIPWSHRPAKTRERPTCKPSYHRYTCACVCSSRNCDILGRGSARWSEMFITLGENWTAVEMSKERRVRETFLIGHHHTGVKLHYFDTFKFVCEIAAAQADLCECSDSICPLTLCLRRQANSLFF